MFGDYTVGTAEIVAETLLQQVPDIDGIFASSDSTALGVMKTLRRLAIQIPSDIAIVGFEDIPLAELMAPSLTTVAQPFREMSNSLVQTLLGELDDPALAKQKIIHDVSIVVRESSLKTGHLGHASETLAEFPL